jgi:hypothetical protein
MADITARLKASPLPTAAKPATTWGKSFENPFGFALQFPRRHWMAFFVDRRLMEGEFEKRVAFLDRYKLIAHSTTELGKGWDIYGEPVGQGALGITVYTSKGKAIAAGTGKISKSGVFSFSLATLYKGMTNRGKIEYKVEGKAKSDGGWEVTGSVSYSK